MRINPKKFLHGLLYLAPVSLLALASCGGGGGSSSASLATYATLSVTVSGMSTATSPLVLRNGADELSFYSDTTQPVAFANQVLSGTTYNISVKSQPTSPTQVCTVSAPVGPMSPGNKTVAVSCSSGVLISGSVNSFGIGSVVLQNNGGDTQSVAAGGSFSFPIVVNGSYNITVLSSPTGYTCSATANTGQNINTDTSGVAINCTAITGATPPDSHLYVANQGSNSAWTYSIDTSTGVPAVSQKPAAQSMPSAIAVIGNKYMFVTDSAANYVSAYAISGVTVSSPPHNTLTENTPTAIAAHPLGKFVYVVNKLSNSISGYSVNTTTGALTSIDTDAVTTGTQSSIKTALTPVAITIDPTGNYAYVASLGSGTVGVCGHTNPSTNGCISLFSIDPNGALTPQIIVNGGSGYNIDTGITPTAIADDGNNVYVTNQADNSGNGSVSVYPIAGSGALGAGVTTSMPINTGPSSISIDQKYSIAYIAGATNDTVLMYGIGGTALTPITSKPTGTTPASVVVDSTGQYVYVANSGSNDISGFSTSSGTTLTSLGSTVGAGTTPVSIVTSP